MGTTANSAASQGVRDALADARTLVLNGAGRGRNLETALAEGSAAVVAVLDDLSDLAALHAGQAAHAAFRAVPGLRE